MVDSIGPTELCDYVRERLPLRARLAGKERLNDIVLIAITEWPIDGLLSCGRGTAAEEKLLDQMATSVSRTYESVHGSEQRYGFFWTFILASVVSAIVQAMLQWWLSRPANRVKMAAWQCSTRGGS